MKFIITGNIKDIEIKQKILDYLYKCIDFNVIRYKIIPANDKNAANIILDEIQNTPDMYITYQINSANYIMLFAIINNEKYSVIIRRDKLKRCKEFNNLTEVEITNILAYEYYTNAKLYNGTIIEGKLATDKNYNIYSVIDIYYLYGATLMSDKLNKKLTVFSEFLEDNSRKSPTLTFTHFLEYVRKYNIITHLDVRIKNSKQNGTFDDFLLFLQQQKCLNKIFKIQQTELDDISNISNFIYKTIAKSNYNINGLVFLPHTTGTFYVYSDRDEFKKLKDQT